MADTQVGQDLRAKDRLEPQDALDLNDDFVLDHEIEVVIANGYAAVFEGNSSAAVLRDAVMSELNAKRADVRAFKQAWA